MHSCTHGYVIFNIIYQCQKPVLWYQYHVFMLSLLYFSIVPISEASIMMSVSCILAFTVIFQYCTYIRSQYYDISIMYSCIHCYISVLYLYQKPVLWCRYHVFLHSLLNFSIVPISEASIMMSISCIRAFTVIFQYCTYIRSQYYDTSIMYSCIHCYMISISCIHAFTVIFQYCTCIHCYMISISCIHAFTVIFQYCTYIRSQYYVTSIMYSCIHCYISVLYLYQKPVLWYQYHVFMHSLLYFSIVPIVEPVLWYHYHVFMHLLLYFSIVPISEASIMISLSCIHAFTVIFQYCTYIRSQYCDSSIITSSEGIPGSSPIWNRHFKSYSTNMEEGK